MATNTTTRKVIVIEVEGKQANITVDGVSKSFKQLNTEIAKMKTGMENTNMATGAASATVLELGRAVSDSNYGIRGMANNLSQVASNFIYTTKQAGTFMGGLVNIGRAFMGPLGLIFLFQGAIALLERWAIESEKAENATDDLSDSLKQEMNILKLYGATLRDVNTSLEDRTALVRGLSALDKDLARQLKEAGNDQKKLADITENFVEQKQIEIDIKQKEKELNESIIKTNEALDYQQGLSLIKLGSIEAQTLELTSKKKVDQYNTGLQTEAQRKLNVANDEQNKVLNELLALYLKLNPEEEKNAGNARSFKKKYLDLSKIILEFERRQELGVERTEKKQLEIKQKYEREDLQRRRDAFIERETLRKEDFMKSDASDKQKALAQKRFEEAEQKAIDDHEKALTKLVSAQTIERANLREEEFNKLIEMDLDTRRRRLDSIRIYSDESRIQASEANNEILQDEIDYQESRLSLFEEGSFERMQAENELSILRMDMQDKEFEHEMLLLDLRMQAQLEYVGFVSGIGQVFSTLGKESEALAKIGLVVQKGAAVAGVVIEAQQANAKILSASASEVGFYKASAAATSLASPFMSKKFLGLAIAAEGGAAKRITKNNVGAGIAIANILATTLTSRTAPSGGGRAGGGEGGGGGRTFDFNLVGSTGTNQLAEAVGGQFQEPIQAYVVSNEMTSQQELDLQIQTGASLGD